MAFRLSHLLLLISFASLFFDASYAGRFTYDEATGEFEKKSKKQLYRLKVVDKAKPAPPKKAPVDDSQKLGDPQWAPFYQQHYALINLDLWLTQFANDLVAELAERESTAVNQERLDYVIHREILQNKLEALRVEMARRTPSRHRWQRSPTDNVINAQKRAHAAKLQLYDGLHDNALTAQVKAETDRLIALLAQLSVRNHEEHHELEALDLSDALALEVLEKLQRRIATNHSAIMRLQHHVSGCDWNDLKEYPAPVEEEYEQICENYAAIIESHQKNYDAIAGHVEQARQQIQVNEKLSSPIVDDPPRPRAPRPSVRKIVGNVAGSGASAAAFVVVAPVQLTAAGVTMAYQRTRSAYEKRHATRQRNRELHQAYCERVQNLDDVVPVGSSVEERAIYQNEFANYAQRTYRFTAKDFEARAKARALIKVQQARRVGELRAGIEAIKENDDVSHAARGKIRRALARSLTKVARKPEQRNDDRHDPEKIAAKILRDEEASIERAQERRRNRDENIAKGIAKEERKKRDVQSRKEGRRTKKIATLARRERLRQERTLLAVQRSEAQALNKTVKARLRAQRRTLERQRAANKENNLRELAMRAQEIQKKSEDEHDAQETLITVLRKRLDQTGRKRAVEGNLFGNENVDEKIQNFDSFADFLADLNARHEKNAEAFVERRKKEKQDAANAEALEKKKALNRENNFEALRIGAKELKRKSDTELDAHEALLKMFWQAVQKKSNRHYVRHAMFANENVIAVLENHEEFDDMLSALNHRYEKLVVALQAERDQQLLLQSAQKGLSKENIGKFRDTAFKELGKDLDALDAEFASPIDGWTTTAHRDPARTTVAFRELRMNQVRYQGIIAVDHEENSPPVPGDQNEHGDDDVNEADTAVLELGNDEALAHFMAWYVEFPKSPATAIHVVSDCSICYGPIGYELVFSSKQNLNLHPGLLLQVPTAGSHKLSSCGHMVCEECVRHLEACAKKIKDEVKLGESIFSPYHCPLCHECIPCDELNEKEFKKAFGKSMYSHHSK